MTLALCTAAGLEQHAEAAPVFATPFQSVEVGGAPRGLAIADLDGDGKRDVVVVTGMSLAVLIGHGDGTFGEPGFFDVGGSPVGVAIGDLNGDGAPDLVEASFPDSVAVLLGNGDGTFGSKRSFGTLADVTSIALADLNGDGGLDAIPGFTADMPDFPGYTVSNRILFGSGDGTFGAVGHFVTPRPATFNAVGDLNGDGVPDLVAASGWVETLLGMGNGTFGTAADHATNSGAASLALADLNGDGRLDIVAASGNPIWSRASVWLGDGGGSFGARQDFTTGTNPHGVALGDLDGDGKPEVVTSNRGATVSVLPGVGDGSFPTRTDYGMGGEPWPPAVLEAVAIADLDADGRPDLVVANSGGGTVIVMMNATPGIPVAVEVSLVSATAAAGVARLEWFSPEPGFGAEVCRSGASGEWTSVGHVAADGIGHLTFEDHAVEPGQRYGYRLVAGRGSEAALGEAWVTVPVMARLELDRVHPNPAKGSSLNVAFVLATQEAARLELLDVSGRRVTWRVVESPGAGPRSEVLRPEAALRSGLYWVRLVQGRHSVTTKVVICH